MKALAKIYSIFYKVKYYIDITRPNQFNEMSSKLKSILLKVSFVSSWVFFPFLTYYGSKDVFAIVPLMLFSIQIFLTIFYKTQKSWILILFNPVVCCAVYNIVKPTVNYIAGRPTIVECSWSPKAQSFNEKESVYLDYLDDDCDWEGVYYYTLDINNFVTKTLIELFGNPLMPQLGKGSTAHNMVFMQ